MRPLLVRLHRYGGLALAIFLILAGVSGSIIAFNEELDAALNPELFHAYTQGVVLSPSALAKRVQQQLPNATITLMPLSVPRGESALLRVAPKTGTLGYDQVFADPVSGKVLGTRKWGAAELTRANIIPLIYLFHYTLKLPGVIGTILMGIVACIWAVDCFIGFALTLPRGKPFWKKWNTSWRVKSGAGNYRLNYDLHRAGGLWLWLLLLMMAVSGVSLNLPELVFRPLLKQIATLSPSPLEIAAKLPLFNPKDAKLDWDAAVKSAHREATQHGWSFTPRYIFSVPAYGAYGVGFSRAGEDGENGLGNSYYYVSAKDGRILAREIMGAGTAGDVFAQAQFPLHSGRIVGLPGRILISLLGLCVAGLSATGIFIWARKRRLIVRAPRLKMPLLPGRLEAAE